MDGGVNGRWTPLDTDGLYESRKTDETFKEENDGLRTVLPQILASSAKNLLLLDLGMTLAYPTIAIAALLESKDDLKFNAEEASWFGSIAFICQPLGSVISGFLFEPLGRKRAMLLVSLPHILGWFLIYFAQSVTYLYLAAVILGVGIGFMEAPIITYVGEICQPKWRGMLAAYAGICASIGFLLVNFLGVATDWRTAAAASAAVPIIAFVAISQVPESPVWLLSKGRVKEAEASLCWLRGWVSPEVVRKEFTYLIQHTEMLKEEEKIQITTISSQVDRSNTEENKPKEKKFSLRKLITAFGLDAIFHRSIMQPLFLVTMFFLINHGSGITSTRPFLVEIFKEFGTSLDGNWVTLYGLEIWSRENASTSAASIASNMLTYFIGYVNSIRAIRGIILKLLIEVISSAIGILGNVVGMVWLRFSGKRTLALVSSLICVLCNFLISIYGFFYFNSNFSWIPLSLFILLNFAWSCGIGQIPWMLTSEIFPFHGRGIASGIAAAGSYVLGFIFTKTYYDLHRTLTLSGAFAFFAGLTFAGMVFLYYFLPETEGKTLREIEVILTDRFRELRIRSNRNS